VSCPSVGPEQANTSPRATLNRSAYRLVVPERLRRSRHLIAGPSGHAQSCPGPKRRPHLGLRPTLNRFLACSVTLGSVEPPTGSYSAALISWPCAIGSTRPSRRGPLAARGGPKSGTPCRPCADLSTAFGAFVPTRNVPNRCYRWALRAAPRHVPPPPGARGTSIHLGGASLGCARGHVNCGAPVRPPCRGGVRERVQGCLGTYAEKPAGWSGTPIEITLTMPEAPRQCAAAGG